MGHPRCMRPGTSMLGRIALVIVLATCLAQAAPTRAATTNTVWSVNYMNDLPDLALDDNRCDAAFTAGDQCTVRAAIQEANISPGGDTIYVPAGTYTFAMEGTNEDNGATGDLDIKGDVVINGPDPSKTSGLAIIDGNALDRVFHIAASNLHVGFNWLTIRNGKSTVAGGGIYNVDGDLTFYKVSITNNRTSQSGGGIYSVADSTMWLIDTRVSNNLASQSGGGILTNRSILKLDNSAVSNNRALNGGGIYSNEASVTVNNTTLNGNQARNSGGGIFAKTLLVQLYNATVADNRADSDGNGAGTGGGIATTSGSASTLARNTLLGGNVRGTGTTASNCAGTLQSDGYNLIQVLSGCTIVGTTTGDKIGVNPLLRPLADNGGYSLTRALQGDSPAVDAGNPAGCRDSQGHEFPGGDQRHYSRTVDGNYDGTSRCDIGAYEYQGPRIKGIIPAQRKQDTGSFKLTITGHNFQPGALVQWNGQNRVPTSISGGAIEVQIPGTFIANPGKATVRVLMPGTSSSSGLSNAKTFTINQ